MTPSDPTIRRPSSEEARTVDIGAGGDVGSTDFTVAGPAPKSLGDFDLLAEIGRGGMGRVYKARQHSPNRIVALKTILTRGPAKPALIQRFKKEAEAAAQLDHPGIVPIYEFKEHGGLHFFTMKFVDGKSLDHRLEQGALDNRMAALVTQKVADAVAFAHAKGVIHRDLKPGNVLLGRDGSVMVTDFGLARRFTVETGDNLELEIGDVTHDANASHRLTLAGSVMGTPGFIAPEQAIDSRQAGPAADIWAIGAILYACLTGKPPFVASGAAETLILVLETEPTPPSELNPACDPELESICLKCLQKDPAHRYKSARELADDLQGWLEGQPIRPKRSNLLARSRRFLESSPELMAIACGLIVHRIGNIQEGIFAGCAVFGIHMASRQTMNRRPGFVAVAVTLLFFAAMMGGQFVTNHWVPSYGYFFSGLAAIVGFAVFLSGCMTVVPVERKGQRQIAVATATIGLAGLCAAWTVAMAADGLRLANLNGEPSSIYTMTWGAAAQVFFILFAVAIIIGFALACMVGLAHLSDLFSLRTFVDRRVILLIGAAIVLPPTIWLTVSFYSWWEVMFDANQKLRIEPGSPWFEAVMRLDRHLGRITSWFLAIGLGLSIGALLGNAGWSNARRSKSPLRQPSVIPVMIGAALGAILVQVLLARVRSSDATETAKFAYFGPGPALSVAEDWIEYQLRLPSVVTGPDPRWCASLGIFWFKVVLLTVPMAMGAILGGMLQRLIGSRASR